MVDKKTAAIDADDFLDTPLESLTADTFLEALGKNNLHLHQWSEKKKVELWTEPENLGKVPVKDVFKGIRTEKKKAELELDPLGSGLGNVFNNNLGTAWQEQLANDIAQKVSVALGRPYPQPSTSNVANAISEAVIANLGSTLGR